MHLRKRRLPRSNMQCAVRGIDCASPRPRSSTPKRPSSSSALTTNRLPKSNRQRRERRRKRIDGCDDGSWTRWEVRPAQLETQAVIQPVRVHHWSRCDVSFDEAREGDWRAPQDLPDDCGMPVDGEAFQEKLVTGRIVVTHWDVRERWSHFRGGKTSWWLQTNSRNLVRRL